MTQSSWEDKHIRRELRYHEVSTEISKCNGPQEGGSPQLEQPTKQVLWGQVPNTSQASGVQVLGRPPGSTKGTGVGKYRSTKTMAGHLQSTEHDVPGVQCTGDTWPARRVHMATPKGRGGLREGDPVNRFQPEFERVSSVFQAKHPVTEQRVSLGTQTPQCGVQVHAVGTGGEWVRT